jgi:hypothetical protein
MQIQPIDQGAEVLINENQFDAAIECIRSQPSGPEKERSAQKLMAAFIANDNPAKAIWIDDQMLMGSQEEYLINLINERIQTLVSLDEQAAQRFIDRIPQSKYQNFAYEFFVRQKAKKGNIEAVRQFIQSLPPKIQGSCSRAMYEGIADYVQAMVAQGEKVAALRLIETILPIIRHSDGTLVCKTYIHAMMAQEEILTIQHFVENLPSEIQFYCHKFFAQEMIAKKGAVSTKQFAQSLNPGLLQNRFYSELGISLIAAGDLVKAQEIIEATPQSNLFPCYKLSCAWLSRGRLPQARTVALTLPDPLKDQLLKAIKEKSSSGKTQ